jgi:hypothetical protein
MPDEELCMDDDTETQGWESNCTSTIFEKALDAANRLGIKLHVTRRR